MEAYWNIPSKDVLKRVQSQLSGLRISQVKHRQAKGKNVLASSSPFSVLSLFFSQFQNPLIYILVVAALISLFLGEFVDATIISIAVFINTFAGFFQELKANKALERLKSLIVHYATVIREGKQIVINSEELVPGDIVVLSAGDKISFDGRLLKSNQLLIDESSFTGESQAVEKYDAILHKDTPYPDQTNMVFMGTTVVGGTGLCVVTTIGKQTKFGQIAAYLEDVKDEKTPLQQALGRLANVIGIVVLSLAILIFFVGLVYGRDPYDMFLTSVALAVAAIPEGLLISLTVILTVGMQRILKKKSIVRKLVAAETLGSVSVICTDKTGTLTEADLKPVGFWTTNGMRDIDVSKRKKWSTKDKRETLLLLNAMLCNDALYDESKNAFVKGSPTEKALISLGHHFALSQSALQKSYANMFVMPFDSEKKWMGVTVSHKKEIWQFMKGSPEHVLNLCAYIDEGHGMKKLTQKRREELRDVYEQMTAKGLRVLGFGYKEMSEKDDVEIFSKQVFLGFVGMKDTLRKEAKRTMALCKKAGIKPVIVTGDHKLTALAIGQDLGLDVKEDEIITGQELAKMSDEELASRIQQIKIYARVFPEQKYRLVKAFQAKKEVVVMLGDGVNDAPALKAADIGIAVGSGTDVAKDVAELVLLDNNFSTIVNAVFQGRIMYENLRKVIVYLLANNFTEMVLITGAMIVGLPLPITAAQILWINLVTDGFPHIALAFEKGDKSLMKEKPRQRSEGLITKEMKAMIFIIGLVTDFILFMLYAVLYSSSFDITYIRSIIFTSVGLASILYVFSIRDFRRTILQIPLFSNIYLIFSFILGFLILCASLYIPLLANALELMPLGPLEWMLIFTLASMKVIGIEMAKWWYFIRKRPIKR